jgi:hypothetical protein
MIKYLLAAGLVLVLVSCGKRAAALEEARKEAKAAAESYRAAQPMVSQPKPIVETGEEKRAEPLSALPQNVPPKTAEPVPGKPGRVFSPYAKGKEVDVTGFESGLEVRCPYSQRVFLVP